MKDTGFKAGDLVQPKKGGPKYEVLDVQGDTLFCTPRNILTGETVTFKAEDVTFYNEEGDLGVC